MTARAPEEYRLYSPDYLAIITAAKALIADPKRWVKNVYARTDVGTKTGPTDDQATCFCTVGALQRAMIEAKDPNWCDDTHRVFGMLARGFYRNSGGDSKVVAMYNDLPETTHAEVMAAFDFAIDWNTPEEEAVSS